jgi:septal ring factor EnvC (AmiA/AmiB activator)
MFLFYFISYFYFIFIFFLFCRVFRRADVEKLAKDKLGEETTEGLEKELKQKQSDLKDVEQEIKQAEHKRKQLQDRIAVIQQKVKDAPKGESGKKRKREEK